MHTTDRSSTPAVRSGTSPSPERTRVVDGIAVTVTRKRIRNLYLRVKPPDGRVEISAPLRVPAARIDVFVRERRDWIVAAQRRIADTVAGTDMALRTAWTDERKARAAAAIEARLPGLLARWTPIVGQAPTHVTLRLMTSRWGSCTPRTGRIRLNLQLAELPPEFLEYVLVHELTHLWAHGHGADFRLRMDRYLPDWRERRRALNRMVIG
ncbi:metal-dependent hydrolase [Bifidobacterium sp. DSM 109958]|uniref:Metal-dependent hydrolase n=1 Tax=Bifidobacterium moraviense TaxID=2675323 RepID=A0A7Y0F3D6_9BIFI|nr:SprT family zinc-dependent metalloprotease [Bifidobacterium sp. DSM 109958]NMN01287.1 metal-dependent hydrolase [Bifidobacterium sp. DSM 109958]